MGRNGRIHARRSNPAVTRWGKGVSVRAPKDTVGITTVQADAQAKVVDVLAHSQQVGNSGFFHTQLEPGISFSATPRRFPRRDVAEGEVHDQGRRRLPWRTRASPWPGRVARPTPNGVCFIPLGPYSKRKRLRAKADARRLHAGEADPARHALTRLIFHRVRGGTYAATLAAAAALALPAPGFAQDTAVEGFDFGGFRNVLPGGQGETVNAEEFAAFEGGGERPTTFVDQLPLYDDLVQAAPNLGDVRPRQVLQAGRVRDRQHPARVDPAARGPDLPRRLQRPEGLRRDPLRLDVRRGVRRRRRTGCS